MGPALVVLAGLMGAGGVAILAAAAHAGGGEMARTAGTMLLVHAAAVLAMARGGAVPLMLAAAALLALGTILFSADLALIAFAGLRPLPLAAPVGGIGMMGGWLMAAAAGAVALLRRRP